MKVRVIFHGERVEEFWGKKYTKKAVGLVKKGG